jgi:hypothetical protein
LTTVLAATASPSSNYMFIFCTSQPDAIDSVSATVPLILVVLNLVLHTARRFLIASTT